MRGGDEKAPPTPRLRLRARRVGEPNQNPINSLVDGIKENSLFDSTYKAIVLIIHPNKLLSFDDNIKSISKKPWNFVQNRYGFYKIGKVR